MRQRDAVVPLKAWRSSGANASFRRADAPSARLPLVKSFMQKGLRISKSKSAGFEAIRCRKECVQPLTHYNYKLEAIGSRKEGRGSNFQHICKTIAYCSHLIQTAKQLTTRNSLRLNKAGVTSWRGAPNQSCPTVRRHLRI